MYFEKFDSTRHLECIGTWLRFRDLRVPPLSEFPAIGFVAYDSCQPLAAAFLRRVEGGFGQIDGLVSNPTAAPKDRDQAIDLVVAQVIKIARQLEIKGLTATSLDTNTLTRSAKYGFVQLPETVIALDLTRKAAHRPKES